eukprot:1287583-Rhodomonas_salina.1
MNAAGGNRAKNEPLKAERKARTGASGSRASIGGADGEEKRTFPGSDRGALFGTRREDPRADDAIFDEQDDSKASRPDRGARHAGGGRAVVTVALRMVRGRASRAIRGI